MRRSTLLVRTPEFCVRVVACEESHHGWSAPEVTDSSGVVLPHRGRFRLLSDGQRHTVDPTRGYLQTPGREYRFSHPAGGDVCTFISVAEPLWDEVSGEVGGRPAGTPVRRVSGHATGAAAVIVDARLELAHRLLLRSTRDAADPAERLVRTLATALSPRHDAAARPPAPGHADLADRAREAILDGDGESADLLRLARLLRVSPAHLSRTFHRHVGMTVSRYRNRVRVSRVLARIEEGETDLARLASEMGFADQAHLSRTVRAELGYPPGRLRHLFSPATREVSVQR